MPNDGRKGATGPGKGAFTQPGSPMTAPPAQPLPPVAAPGISLADVYGQVPGVDSSYAKAIATARGGIDRQFGLALSDIASREGSGNAAINQLPGQLSDIYNQGQGQLMRGTAAIQGAMDASGLKSFVPMSALMQPVNNAMQVDKSSRMADVPLLRIGAAAQFQKERAAVAQARAAAESEQSTKEADYAREDARHAADQRQNFLMAQYEAQQRERERRQGYAHDEHMAGVSHRQQQQDFLWEQAHTPDKETGHSPAEYSAAKKQFDSSRKNGGSWSLARQYADSGDPELMTAVWDNLNPLQREAMAQESPSFTQMFAAETADPGSTQKRSHSTFGLGNAPSWFQRGVKGAALAPYSGIAALYGATR